MKQNSDLAKGLVDGANARDKKTKLWEKITKNLNEIGPPIRNVSEWKKVVDHSNYFLKIIVKYFWFCKFIGMEFTQI